MSGESEERHMGTTVSLNEFTIDQTDTGTRPGSDHSQCTVGLPMMQLINLLPYVSFLPAY